MINLIFFLQLSPVVPQILPFSFGEEPLNAGETASIQCIVTKGDNPLNITWFFNGKRIDDSLFGVTTTRSNKKIGTLIIDSVQEAHFGNYTCVAENFAAFANYTTDLTVNGTSLLFRPSIACFFVWCTNSLQFNPKSSLLNSVMNLSILVTW